MVLFRTLAIAGIKHFIACALVHSVCNGSPLQLPTEDFRKTKYHTEKKLTEFKTKSRWPSYLSQATCTPFYMV